MTRNPRSCNPSLGHVPGQKDGEYTMHRPTHTRYDSIVHTRFSCRFEGRAASTQPLCFARPSLLRLRIRSRRAVALRVGADSPSPPHLVRPQSAVGVAAAVGVAEPREVRRARRARDRVKVTPLVAHALTVADRQHAGGAGAVSGGVEVRGGEVGVAHEDVQRARNEPQGRPYRIRVIRLQPRMRHAHDTQRAPVVVSSAHVAKALEVNEGALGQVLPSGHDAAVGGERDQEARVDEPHRAASELLVECERLLQYSAAFLAPRILAFRVYIVYDWICGELGQRTVRH
mmetsp:Transcript_15040/g.43115  ORF Transcript_15040/g.43115 Transcript_15040/m.43115 type:complete len:287 (+) Transcript_15040:37-897(+)